jgi:hypothetical protein
LAVTVVLLCVAALGSGWGAFLMLGRAINEPRIPTLRGGIEYFVAEPGLTGTLTVDLGTVDPSDSRDSATPEDGYPHIDVSLTVQGSRPGRSLDWALVLTGDARLADMRIGNPTGQSHVTHTHAGRPALSGNEELLADVVTGRSTTNDKGTAYATISGKSLRRLVAHSAGRSQLTLPTYGTPFIGQLRPDPSNRISIHVPGRWRPPDTCETTIEAGQLASESRLDFSSPPLDDPGRLQWRTAYERAPHASWVTGRAAALSQRLLFLGGVLAGLAASIVLTLVARFLLPERREQRPKASEDTDVLVW